MPDRMPERMSGRLSEYLLLFITIYSWCVRNYAYHCFCSEGWLYDCSMYPLSWCLDSMVGIFVLYHHANSQFCAPIYLRICNVHQNPTGLGKDTATYINHGTSRIKSTEATHCHVCLLAPLFVTYTWLPCIWLEMQTILDVIRSH